MEEVKFKEFEKKLYKNVKRTLHFCEKVILY